ncbi:MAG: hypothetical protein Q9166_000634 [cf. Caloplaca sp. 2 TL-2023]
MPIYTIHLIALHTPLPHFLENVAETPFKPLLTARIIRWIIKPTLLHASPAWDTLLIYPGPATSLPNPLRNMIQREWSIQAGIPSSIITSFSSTNTRLLSPSSSSDNVPPLTGSLSDPVKAESAQSLELNDELQHWIESSDAPKGAVSMLNLLAFNPGAKAQYLEYGKAFPDSVGKRRGGVAKLVGKIVEGSSSDGSGEWDEMALAQYPSLKHFADMIASEDYQDANQKWRLPSLRDTCILCTSEVALGGDVDKAKL